MTERCFLCGKPLKGIPWRVFCADDQAPFVGRDCFKKVLAAGDLGYPSKPPVFSEPVLGVRYSALGEIE